MPTGTPILPKVDEPPRYDPVQVAELMTEKLITGKGGEIVSRAGKASEKDQQIFKRIVGESVEVFNSRLSSMLGEVSEDVVHVIKRKLANDEFKPGELAFLFSVMHDKRLSMDGRSQVSNASINVQVNNYGSATSKADLIAMLEGRKPGQVTELPVEKAG